MFNHFLKVAFRNLLKRKTFSLINILGLAIAMAVCLLIFFYIQYEYSYDKMWKNSPNMYRVNYTRYQNGELSYRSAKNLGGMAQVMKEDIPGVVGATELFKDMVTVYTRKNQIQDIQMFVADSSFLSVFNLDFIQQKNINPLADLYSSVISESAAKRFFGNENPIGKIFRVNMIWDFEVTGVFKDLPDNSHIHFDLLLTAQTYRYYFSNWNYEKDVFELKDPDSYRKNVTVSSWDWGYSGKYCYVLLNPGTNPKQVESEIKRLSGKYTKEITQNNGRAEFALQPVTDIHLKSKLDSEIRTNGDLKNILALALIGLIILVIAWINFINLTLALALERARETGVRKVVGAFKVQIVYQYLLEYSIINLISICLAFVMAMLSRPIFLKLVGKSSEYARIGDPNLWLILVLLFVIGLAISVFYPAFVQSSICSLSLFKPGQQRSPNRISLKKVLVVAQFTVSIVLIICVFTVYQQIKFMRSQDLGVNIERTLVTYSPMSEMGPQTVNNLKVYKARITKIPGVESMATSSAIPGSEILWQRQDIRRSEDLPGTVKSYNYCYIDHDYIGTFMLYLIAGRNFTDNAGAEAKNVILNESAMKQLGLRDVETAVNTFILISNKLYKIIGILKDYHQESLKKEIKPIVYFYGYEWYCSIGFFSIKIKSPDVISTIAKIKEVWKDKYPIDQFEYFFLDDAFNRQYEGDQQFGRIFAFFTLLAILIACLGLYALSKFSTLNRTKEIGIRKVNGASTASILVILLRDFTKSVALAFLIACPISYYVMHGWLQNFAYRTSLSWWVFILAGIFAMVIALITISSQAWLAANRNPVEALRSE